MDDDDNILGLLINLTIGAVVVAVEISFAIVALAIMVPVAIYEIFFEDGPE